MLFVTSTFDVPILFQGRATERAIDRAEEFYLSMFASPLTITAFFHAVLGLGMIGIVTKLHRWTENDRYFGMGSVGTPQLLTQCSISVRCSCTSR